MFVKMFNEKIHKAGKAQ